MLGGHTENMNKTLFQLITTHKSEYIPCAAIVLDACGVFASLQEAQEHLGNFAYSIGVDKIYFQGGPQIFTCSFWTDRLSTYDATILTHDLWLGDE